MPCYNAAMSKPWQFSMRRMLAAMTLFCVAAYVLSFQPDMSSAKAAAASLILVFSIAFASVGAGIGTIMHQTTRGAAIGLLAGLAMGSLAFLSSIGP